MITNNTTPAAANHLKNVRIAKRGLDCDDNGFGVSGFVIESDIRLSFFSCSIRVKAIIASRNVFFATVRDESYRL